MKHNNGVDGDKRKKEEGSTDVSGISAKVNEDLDSNQAFKMKKEQLKELEVQLKYKKLAEKVLIYDSYIRRSYFKLSVDFIR